MKICSTEKEFIEAVAPAAQKACKRYGFYLPSVLIAQACKELGYAIPSYWDNKGVRGLVEENNMVGIKRQILNKSWVSLGLSVWPGKYLSKLTPEVYGNEQVIIPDDFRIYDNPEQSFCDYLCFMRWGAYQVGGEPKYYGKIKNLKDPASLIRQVHSLGYATGPTYSSGVISIVNKHNLTKYDNLSAVVPSDYYPHAAKKEKEKPSVNSPLVNYTRLSPFNSGKRTRPIDRITPHCYVGQAAVEDMCAWFATTANCSCNYGIGKDGRVALVVREDYRSWCSSSSVNDQRAVTIECACEKNHPYEFNPVVYQKLIDLCADICRRNGKKKLLWFGGKETTLNYDPASDEMVLTVHRWFAPKACPGDWMMARMGDLAAKVTAALGGNLTPGGTTPTDGATKVYRVQLGAYKERSNAERKVRQVSSAGFECFITDPGSDGMIRVQAGAYNIKANAEMRLAEIQNAGFDAFINEN